jgi:hypothetical protein
MYTPDGWMLVKINGDDPHYRIFGSWAGGYVDGDSWRMNSGITDCKKEGDTFEFYGYSGSVYIVHKNTYGKLTMHNWGMLKKYCDNSAGTMEIVEEMPQDLENFDWII